MMALQAAVALFVGFLLPFLVTPLLSPEGRLDAEPQAERPLVVDAAVSSHDLATGAITEALKKQVKRNAGGGTQELAQSLRSYSSSEDTRAATEAAALKRKEYLAEALARGVDQRAAAIDRERVRHGRVMKNAEDRLQSKLDELHREKDKTFAAEHEDEEELRQDEQALMRIARRRRDMKHRRSTAYPYSAPLHTQDIKNGGHRVTI